MTENLTDLFFSACQAQVCFCRCQVHPDYSQMLSLLVIRAHTHFIRSCQQILGDEQHFISAFLFLLSQDIGFFDLLNRKWVFEIHSCYFSYTGHNLMLNFSTMHKPNFINLTVDFHSSFILSE